MLQLTVEGTPDLRAAMDALDSAALPSEEEIDAVTRKRLTKDSLVLTTLSPNETIQKDDTVVFSVTGGTGKYDKPKLMVTVGQGLYNKDIETSMIGHRTGDTYEVQAEDATVHVVIREIRRKTVPEVTDEMAAAMGIDGVNTVAAYREHLANAMIRDRTSRIMVAAFDKLMEQVRISEPDEDTVTHLGRLEWADFKAYYMERNHLSSPDDMPEEAKERYSDARRDEHIRTNRDRYVGIAKECVLFSAVLGIPLQGEWDPMADIDVVARLQHELFNAVLEELKRRKA